MMRENEDKITQDQRECIDMILDHINEVGIEEFKLSRYSDLFKDSQPDEKSKAPMIDLSAGRAKLSGINEKGFVLTFYNGEIVTFDWEDLKAKRR